jgi:hypothetical protein
MTPYQDFTKRFALLIAKNPDLITTTLSNIFTMRLIGNKTHGDLAEIAIAEFINQYMYDFRSIHVGKDLYRAKEREEDIQVINEITKAEFSISLKAYGDGPLQLSTDKHFTMFPKLQQLGRLIEGQALRQLWDDNAFSSFGTLNILPLIYNEKAQKCNILVFDDNKAKQAIQRVVLEDSGKGRTHPVYRFYDANHNYVCEVRYGGATANALQRGLWTNTKNGMPYFESITNGWITYAHNPILVRLFSHALLATQQGHETALEVLKQNIESQKLRSVLQ